LGYVNVVEGMSTYSNIIYIATRWSLI
jgi:hypothetical protein